MSPTAPKPQPEGLSSQGRVYSRSFLWRLMKQWDVQLMVIPGIILVLIFSYLPMYGVLTGFMDYNLFTGSRIWENPWVGFKHFEAFFAAPEFERLIRNTIVISLLKFFIGFPAPIILALMLNEVRHMFFKRVVQTITYLPHFMSWVIVAGLTTALLATENGSVNMLLQTIGTIQEPINFLSLKEYFLSILISANVWKEIGFGSIVYLAAIASVDPHLYEAADMDGASKFKQIYLITLPSIMPVVVIFMILAIGNLLNAGFEDILLLATNPVLRPVSDVIDTYVYRVGIGSHRYSYGVAIGLFKAIISIGLLTIANYIARRSGNSLW
ncbi:ABC transporter permease [Paenibacillus lautus]|jgi:putative aldouronate transport system permease protein|uniref:Sugar ABC transporter permease n=1 Tax=Paenibacillus lautus TaxID=1401 RepID=A0A385TXC4_PAELA|nr:ABC transporter permease subunit [Paenibacillus lautus]AYB47648.1 sugar ABC transporter permease [Paenibacillus lautus]MCI1774429.1 ABC transporter permease subunit [Paenibacillus lautus]